MDIFPPKTEGSWKQICSTISQETSSKKWASNLIQKSVVNGLNTMFWHEIWLGDIPLKLLFQDSLQQPQIRKLPSISLVCEKVSIGNGVSLGIVRLGPAILWTVPTSFFFFLKLLILTRIQMTTLYGLLASQELAFFRQVSPSPNSQSFFADI